MITELEKLLGGYFDQDWEDEYDSPDEVVSQFLEDGRTENELRRLIDEIDLFLLDQDGNDRLEAALLSRFQCYYVPSQDGLSVQEWLLDVKSQISRALSRGAEN